MPRIWTPCFRTRFAGVGHIVEFPNGCSIAQLEGADPALAGEFRSRGPNEHKVVIDQRRHAEEITVGGLYDLSRPEFFSGRCVQRQKITVGCATDYFAVFDSRAAMCNVRLVVPRRPLILPDGFAGRAVKRHRIMRGRREDNAVINDRRSLRRHFFREAIATDLNKVRRVLRIDLIKRRVPMAAIIMIGVEPVGSIVRGVVQLCLRRTGGMGAAAHQKYTADATE